MRICSAKRTEITLPVNGAVRMETELETVDIRTEPREFTSAKRTEITLPVNGAVRMDTELE